MLPAATVWFGPASATGAWLTYWTVMLTLAGRLCAMPSLTTSWKVRMAPAGATVGAVKLGCTRPCCCVELDDRASDLAPGVEVRGRPAGTLTLPEPSRVTEVPSSTVPPEPALAMGTCTHAPPWHDQLGVQSPSLAQAVRQASAPQT